MRRIVLSVAPILCALISGALLFASTQNGHVWWLAWIAVTPLLWLTYGRAPAWQVALAGFVAYMIGAGNLYLAYGPMVFPLLWYVPLVAAAFAMCALFVRMVHNRLGIVAALFAFPSAWTAVEYAVAMLSPNGSYGAWAYSQAFVPLVIQGASVFGLWIVTFLLSIASNALALMVRDVKRSVGAVVIAAVLLLGNVLFGAIRLSAVSAMPVRVGLATDDALPFAQRRASAVTNGREYASLAARLARAGASAIVLPEKISKWNPAWSDVVEPFHKLAAESGVTIVVGFEEDAAQAQNVALTFRPNGTVDRYAKQHLIPGLEPLIPGHEPGTLGNGQTVAICKDLDFQLTIRHDAQAGQTTIAFVPAWDFVRDADTHAALAIFRGVENGFAVVRSARNGLMTVTDAQGRLVARAVSDPSGPVLLLASVSPGPGPTIYTRIGDCFAWLCALASTAMLAAVAFHSKRSTSVVYRAGEAPQPP